MPRSRRVVVDENDQTFFIDSGLRWIDRKGLLQVEPSPPGEDYVTYTLFPVPAGDGEEHTQIAIWGNGLISFGPVTAAQIAFMSSLPAQPDFTLFPGDYIAAAALSESYLDLVYGRGERDFAINPFARTDIEHASAPEGPAPYDSGDAVPVFYATWATFEDADPDQAEGYVLITPDFIELRGSDAGGGFTGARFGDDSYVAGSPLAQTLYFSDFEVTTGTGAAETLDGSAAPETLRGLGGNDALNGKAGGDRLEGGDGGDVADGGGGNDRLFGEAGNDRLIGGAGHDQLFGGNDSDRLDGGYGEDLLDGGSGVDTALLDFSAATSRLVYVFDGDGPVLTTAGVKQLAGIEAAEVRGGEHSDVMSGGGGADRLDGGGGRDVLIGGGGNDVLIGGGAGGFFSSQIDKADFRAFGLLNNALQSAATLDHAFDLSAVAEIANATTVPHVTINGYGTGGADFYAFTAGQAGATVTIDVDGADFDSVVTLFNAAGTPIASNDNGGVFDAGSNNSNDSLLTFTLGAAGVYFFSIDSNVGGIFEGGTYRVQVSLSSAQVLAANVMDGGAGDDQYHVALAADRVLEASGGGTDRIFASTDYVLAPGVHVEILSADSAGGTAPIDLAGNELANTLIGNAGINRLDGNGGNDLLIGGLGADRLIGDGGVDTADYSGNFGAVSVNLTTNLGQFNFAEGDIYSEVENVNGTEFNDILTGSAAVNVLNGNGGNDIIKGQNGADIMNGGLGIDTADYSGNFGAVSIDLQAGTGTLNFAQGDVLTSFENVRGTEYADTLDGSGAANVLTGNGGSDRLAGRNGDDQLIGGAGNDILIGGLGADRLDGGAGVDTANYSGNFGAVSVNLFTGLGAMNYAQGDTYISIDKVIGTDFNDIFESNGVTNVFTGGLGNDTFIFRPGFSEDIIIDFDGNGAAAGDTIRFRTGVFTDYADMLASASQQGADVVIEADPANILILQNVLLGDLHSSDFIFG